VDKAGLLESIAATGYNVGFGAKKHFATFDIVEKVPGWIGFTSSAVGILALVIEPLSAKLPSDILVILGTCTFYINAYKGKDYDVAGRKLTQIFNQLRDLYQSVEGGADVQASHEQLKALESTYYSLSISKQILFSDWYAHYKFFAQQQMGWIDDQLNFTWKDKIPLSLRIFAGLVAAGVIALLGYVRFHS
jgi:hypothetical protein